MGLWIIGENISQIPAMFHLVVASAFNGHAAVGGFLGSTVILAMTQGFMRGAYSADIGIGYASIVHSETSNQSYSRQASLTIIGIFLDTFIVCTFSVFIVLLTNTWQVDPGMMDTPMIETALNVYFPYVHIFMPLFLFLLGYSTIITYFAVGEKCSKFLSPRFGKFLFYSYAILAFLTTSYVRQDQLLMIMSLSGGLLLLINIVGFFKLRDEVSFNLEASRRKPKEEKQTVSNDSL